MKKNNIRSIRFSDELAELIEQQIGETFTQKFENLITKCVWELPQKEKQLKDIQKQIDQKRQRLYDLQKTVEQLRQLEQNIKNAQYYCTLVEEQTKIIAETAKKEK